MTSKRIILYISIFVVSFIGISLWSAWLVTHPSRIESELTPKNFNLLFEEVALTTYVQPPSYYSRSARAANEILGQDILRC